MSHSCNDQNMTKVWIIRIFILVFINNTSLVTTNSLVHNAKIVHEPEKEHDERKHGADYDEVSAIEDILANHEIAQNNRFSKFEKMSRDAGNKRPRLPVVEKSHFEPITYYSDNKEINHGLQVKICCTRKKLIFQNKIEFTSGFHDKEITSKNGKLSKNPMSTYWYQVNDNTKHAYIRSNSDGTGKRKKRNEHFNNSSKTFNVQGIDLSSTNGDYLEGSAQTASYSYALPPLGIGSVPNFNFNGANGFGALPANLGSLNLGFGEQNFPSFPELSVPNANIGALSAFPQSHINSFQQNLGNSFGNNQLSPLSNFIKQGYNAINFGTSKNNFNLGSLNQQHSIPFQSAASINDQSYFPQLFLSDSKKEELEEQVKKELTAFESQLSDEQRRTKELYESIPGVGEKNNFTLSNGSINRFDSNDEDEQARAYINNKGNNDSDKIKDIKEEIFNKENNNFDVESQDTDGVDYVSKTAFSANDEVDVPIITNTESKHESYSLDKTDDEVIEMSTNPFLGRDELHVARGSIPSLVIESFAQSSLPENDVEVITTKEIPDKRKELYLDMFVDNRWPDAHILAPEVTQEPNYEHSENSHNESFLQVIPDSYDNLESLPLSLKPIFHMPTLQVGNSNADTDLNVDIDVGSSSNGQDDEKFGAIEFSQNEYKADSATSAVAHPKYKDVIVEDHSNKQGEEFVAEDTFPVLISLNSNSNDERKEIASSAEASYAQDNGEEQISDLDERGKAHTYNEITDKKQTSAGVAPVSTTMRPEEYTLYSSTSNRLLDLNPFKIKDANVSHIKYTKEENHPKTDKNSQTLKFADESGQGKHTPFTIPGLLSLKIEEANAKQRLNHNKGDQHHSDKTYIELKHTDYPVMQNVIIYNSTALSPTGRLLVDMLRKSFSTLQDSLRRYNQSHLSQSQPKLFTKNISTLFNEGEREMDDGNIKVLANVVLVSRKNNKSPEITQSDVNKANLLTIKGHEGYSLSNASEESGLLRSVSSIRFPIIMSTFEPLPKDTNYSLRSLDLDDTVQPQKIVDTDYLDPQINESLINMENKEQYFKSREPWIGPTVADVGYGKIDKINPLFDSLNRSASRLEPIINSSLNNSDEKLVLLNKTMMGHFENYLRYINKLNFSINDNNDVLKFSPIQIFNTSNASRTIKSDPKKLPKELQVEDPELSIYIKNINFGDFPRNFEKSGKRYTENYHSIPEGEKANLDNFAANFTHNLTNSVKLDADINLGVQQFVLNSSIDDNDNTATHIQTTVKVNFENIPHMMQYAFNRTRFDPFNVTNENINRTSNVSLIKTEDLPNNKSQEIVSHDKSDHLKSLKEKQTLRQSAYNNSTIKLVVPLNEFTLIREDTIGFLSENVDKFNPPTHFSKTSSDLKNLFSSNDIKLKPKNESIFLDFDESIIAKENSNEFQSNENFGNSTKINKYFLENTKKLEPNITIRLEISTLASVDDDIIDPQNDPSKHTIVSNTSSFTIASKFQPNSKFRSYFSSSFLPENGSKLHPISEFNNTNIDEISFSSENEDKFSLNKEVTKFNSKADNFSSENIYKFKPFDSLSVSIYNTIGFGPENSSKRDANIEDDDFSLYTHSNSAENGTKLHPIIELNNTNIDALSSSPENADQFSLHNELSNFDLKTNNLSYENSYKLKSFNNLNAKIYNTNGSALENSFNYQPKTKFNNFSLDTHSKSSDNHAKFHSSSEINNTITDTISSSSENTNKFSLNKEFSSLNLKTNNFSSENTYKSEPKSKFDNFFSFYRRPLSVNNVSRLHPISELKNTNDSFNTTSSSNDNTYQYSETGNDSYRFNAANGVANKSDDDKFFLNNSSKRKLVSNLSAKYINQYEIRNQSTNFPINFLRKLYNLVKSNNTNGGGYDSLLNKTSSPSFKIQSVKSIPLNYYIKPDLQLKNMINSSNLSKFINSSNKPSALVQPLNDIYLNISNLLYNTSANFPFVRTLGSLNKSTDFNFKDETKYSDFSLASPVMSILPNFYKKNLNRTNVESLKTPFKLRKPQDLTLASSHLNESIDFLNQSILNWFNSSFTKSPYLLTQNKNST